MRFKKLTEADGKEKGSPKRKLVKKKVKPPSTATSTSPAPQPEPMRRVRRGL